MQCYPGRNMMKVNSGNRSSVVVSQGYPLQPLLAFTDCSCYSVSQPVRIMYTVCILYNVCPLRVLLVPYGLKTSGQMAYR